MRRSLLATKAGKNHNCQFRRILKKLVNDSILTFVYVFLKMKSEPKGSSTPGTEQATGILKIPDAPGESLNRIRLMFRT